MFSIVEVQKNCENLSFDWDGMDIFKLGYGLYSRFLTTHVSTVLNLRRSFCDRDMPFLSPSRFQKAMYTVRMTDAQV